MAVARSRPALRSEDEVPRGAGSLQRDRLTGALGRCRIDGGQRHLIALSGHRLLAPRIGQDRSPRNDRDAGAIGLPAVAMRAALRPRPDMALSFDRPPPEPEGGG